MSDPPKGFTWHIIAQLENHLVQDLHMTHMIQFQAWPLYTGVTQGDPISAVVFRQDDLLQVLEYCQGHIEHTAKQRAGPSTQQSNVT